MPTQQKIDRVQDIKARLERSSITMTASYSGITVNEMIELRRAMRAGGIDFTIVKNTLLNLAATEANKPQIKEIINGPTAVAIAYDDPAAAAKTLADFIRDGGTSLAILGAVMGDGAPMASGDVTKLASLPPKPVLLAMLLGQMQTPIPRLATVMNGPIQALDNVLQARVRQMMESNPVPAEPPNSTTETAVPVGVPESTAEEATADEESTTESEGSTDGLESETPVKENTAEETSE